MLSIPHVIIIFVVALVVFGPEKLPELARTLGKVMGEFRRATGDLRGTFEDHLRDLEREAEQRKIGGGAPSAKPAANPSERTVQAAPPNRPVVESSSSPATAEAAGRGSSEAALSVTTHQEPTQSAELTSETPTDGGTQPA
jgi:TatA/E family protein of Tat protein translocase